MVELPARHTEAETRRLEDVASREKVRAKDVAWRQRVRAEDVAWRAEDVAWREKVRAEEVAWREKVRAEDVVWREKVQAEELGRRSEAQAAERADRDASTSQIIQCLARSLAFIAAAQIAKPGAPTEELARMALDFTQWIGGVAGTTDEDT
jgi:hypothetical protein